MSDTYSASTPGDDDNDNAGVIPTTQDQSQDQSPPAESNDGIDASGGGGQTGAAQAPMYEQAGPFTPEQEALNTREKALDKSGLGGAFGAAQHQRINDARSQVVQQLLQHAMTTGGNTETAGGALDASTQDQDQTPDPGPLGGAVRQIGQKIGQAAASYGAGLYRLLSGAGAMDHHTAEVVATSVNPDGSNPTESLDAVNKATQRGGPEAGVAFMQNRIGIYNASRAWAAAAYDGKNLSASVDAANRAFKALPMAEQVKFSPAANGNVTATVSAANEGDQPISYTLPSANFRELLRGQSGFSLDMLMQGPNQVLSKLAGEDHGLGADPNSQGVAPGPNGKVTDDLKALGVNQATYNLGFTLFPWSGQQAQRNQWFAGQVQQKEQQTHELDVAKQQGVNRRDVAEIQGGTRKDVAVSQGQVRRDVSTEHETNANKRTQIRADERREEMVTGLKKNRDNIIARSKIADKNIAGRQVDTVIRGLEAGTISEPDADAMFKKHGTSLDEILGRGTPAGGGSSGQQAPTTRSGSSAVPGASQARPPGAVYFKDGQYFDKDKNPL